MAAEKLTYPNKKAGDLWRSTDANEVKAVINSHADDINELESSLASAREVATRNSNTIGSLAPRVETLEAARTTTEQTVARHAQLLTALETHSAAEYHDATGVGTGGVLIVGWKLHVWEEPVPALDIRLGDSPQNPNVEYRLRFTVRGDSFSLSFGYIDGTAFSVSWIGDEPEWEAGVTYEVSLMGGIAVGAGTVATPLGEL